MRQFPCNGQKIFEVSIYNREVRSLVKDNLSHMYFEDHWADPHKHDVCAKNEDEARALIANRFPPDDGFVIEDVRLSA